MATKVELVNAALAEIRRATWAPTKWVYAIGHGYRGEPYNYAATFNFKAQRFLWEAARAPGASPPPSEFASPALQEAYIQMAAAYWTPDQWATAVRDGYKGAPYQYALTRNWKAQVALWEARAVPAPPPPPPDPVVPADPRMQNVAVGAFSPWDALAWPGCRIWISADPGPATAQWVSRSRADDARSEGHDIGTWYVPDQVSLERAREVADILGTDLIAADIETKYRMKLAAESGIRRGIANLSDICEMRDGQYVAPDLVQMIASGEFHVINELYWNQSRSRQPDNHNLPVDSLCIAVYNGCSDSSAPDCFEPHVPDYIAAGYMWPTVSVYQQNMKPDDWAKMPAVLR